MNIIIYDFEVFKFDTLFGAYILDDNMNLSKWQTWDLDEIRSFYHGNVDAIWVGHNIEDYDDHILQHIVQGADEAKVKSLNDRLIRQHIRPRLTMSLMYYDLMKAKIYSLKATEAYKGKNISESKVDFNVNRPLTAEERRLSEDYNNDDLQQTYENFIEQLNDFTLRLDVMREFNLPMSCLSVTGTQLAEEVLHAKKIEGIEDWVQLPKMYPNLQVKHQEVLDFFLNRDYASGKTIDVMLCGVQHRIAAGGIHGAKRKYYCKEALYFDVSGYYNLIMINLDLLPRSIPDEYKRLYKHMYEQQLILKKTDPGKRGVYKTILLSVFGAMNNKWCRFYDPYRGDLVRLSGQMFLVDLLEKLEGKVEIVQSNTDGVIAEPLPGVPKDEIRAIIDEWQARTGFVLKIETISDIWQRDVNCYCYRDADGNIHTVGEAVTQYDKWQWMFWKNAYASKEPVIISIALVNYLMNKVPVEETLEQFKYDNIRLFQFICRKVNYDWVEYEETNLATNETAVITVQAVNRAFPLKSDEVRGMLYKKKYDDDGSIKSSKIPNLPDNIFVYNEEILSQEAIDKLLPMIDFQYYVDRTHEKILTFIDKFPTIKKIN